MVLKRLFDVLVAGTALVLLSPLLLALGWLVWRRHGRPVLFRQLRPGRHGRPFAILKFRTMREALDPHGRLLPDAERLTAFGSWLRATSLDELPELWNVLVGDMSLVGPRPLLMEYVPLYSPEQARRHEVRPGLTGWAQVNGRNAVDWPERFRLDTWYVDNRSFWLDLRILAMTVRAVLKREGITGEGSATVEPFRGNLGA
jgi:lipopolysaccharide/colanic/teichoic acid biosynthesis glycosyltransferase